MNLKGENNYLLAFLIGGVMGMCACGALILTVFLLPANETTAATASSQIAFVQVATNTIEPNLSPTQILTLVIPVTSKPTESAILAPYAECIPANERQTARVMKIVDGDTIEIEMDWQTYKLRYIGIDAPEQTPVQFMSEEASEANAQLVRGKDIIFVKDVSETDDFNRLLGYVIADGVFVNRELVVLGYASAEDYPPDTACSQTFAEAMTEAKSARLSLWSVAPNPEPVNEKSNTIDVREGCDPSYPDVCIAPPPPYKNCKDIPDRNFRVIGSDPHNFDDDGDGVGCEGK